MILTYVAPFAYFTATIFFLVQYVIAPSAYGFVFIFSAGVWLIVFIIHWIVREDLLMYALQLNSCDSTLYPQCEVIVEYVEPEPEIEEDEIVWCYELSAEQIEGSNCYSDWL